MLSPKEVLVSKRFFVKPCSHEQLFGRLSSGLCRPTCFACEHLEVWPLQKSANFSAKYNYRHVDMSADLSAYFSYLCGGCRDKKKFHPMRARQSPRNRKWLLFPMVCAWLSFLVFVVPVLLCRLIRFYFLNCFVSMKGTSDQKL